MLTDETKEFFRQHLVDCGYPIGLEAGTPEGANIRSWNRKMRKRRRDRERARRNIRERARAIRYGLTGPGNPGDGGTTADTAGPAAS